MPRLHLVRWTSALVLALATTPLSSAAGEAATAADRPLPLPIFGPGVAAVVRVKLASVTSARADEAMRAILPADQLGSGGGAVQVSKSLDASLVGPLRAAGVAAFDLVMIDGGAGGTLAQVVMVPFDPALAGEQVPALERVAKGLKMSATRMKTWVAMHKDPLPPSEDVPISDAPFEEALARLPDRDVVAVFVPSAGQRASMEKQYEGRISAAGNDADRQSLLQSTRGLVQADWYAVAVDLGSTPSVTITARMGGDEAATALRAGMARTYERMKADIRKKAESADDPKKRYDPAPLLEMVDALAVRGEGEMAEIRMEQAELRDLAAGIKFAIERAQDAVADAIVSAFFPSKPGAKRKGGTAAP